MNQLVLAHFSTGGNIRTYVQLTEIPITPDFFQIDKTGIRFFNKIVFINFLSVFS